MKTITIAATLAASALTPFAATVPATAADVTTCTTSSLVNGSFEQPGGVRAASAGPANVLKPVPGWSTTEPNGLIELWGPGNAAANNGLGVVADSGAQFAELNSTGVHALYQDIPTVPGSTLAWSLAHRARKVAGTPAPDVMQVQLGAPGGPLTAQGPNLTGATAGWNRAGGTYVVPAGQTTTRILLKPISSSSASYGNFVDSVEVLNSGCAPVTLQQCDLTGFVNGGFELPGGVRGAGRLGRDVPGWKTTEPNGLIELWGPGTAAANNGLEAPADSGSQFVEINSTGAYPLYQDIPTVPGSTFTWSLAHRARKVAGVTAPDVLRVEIGAPGRVVPQGSDRADGVAAWGHHSGSYTVPAGQTVTRFKLTPISSAIVSYGNFLDSVRITTDCGNQLPSIADISVFAPEGEPVKRQVPATDPDGDPLTYTVTDPSKLPPGVTLSPTGELSADAMPEGVYDIPVKVCDSTGACATGTVHISTYVACGDLSNKRCGSVADLRD